VLQLVGGFAPGDAFRSALTGTKRSKHKWGIRMLPFVIGLVLLLATSSAPLRQASDASGFSVFIVGWVHDDDGTPVGGALVEAIRVPATSDNFLAGTNKDGSFALKVNKTGVFRLYASKERELYPDLTWAPSLYSPVTVEVTESAPGRVDAGGISLGPKGAKVTGKVVDAATGEPVPQAVARITCVTCPETFAIRGLGITPNTATFSTVLPATRVRIEVEEINDEDRGLGADKVKRQSLELELEPGTTHELIIAVTKARRRARLVSRDAPN
jgi:hypothetical protein